MRVRTTAEDLARWIECEGGLWTVEGEPTLVSHLPQPAPADALAQALRSRSAQLMVLAPETSAFGEDARIASTDLPRAAHDVDGHNVFQLAWVAEDGSIMDSWLLAEFGALTESGERKLSPTASGAAMVEVLRREQSAGTPRIAKKPR